MRVQASMLDFFQNIPITAVVVRVNVWVQVAAFRVLVLADVIRLHDVRATVHVQVFEHPSSVADDAGRL